VTLRLTIGIDPGLSGALAILADGKLIALHDMPTVERTQGKGDQVDGALLAGILRGLRAAHSGADVLCCLEKVGGFRGQGGASMFSFGQAEGIVRGVLGALGIAIVEPRPQTWKKRFRIDKQEKDAARELAILMFPAFREQLKRKKDGGRADAALIAAWAYLEEAEPYAAPLPAIFRQEQEA
jgi:crossover junction endodeoxyribonuclease RuvC